MNLKLSIPRKPHNRQIIYRLSHFLKTLFEAYELWNPAIFPLFRSFKVAQDDASVDLCNEVGDSAILEHETPDMYFRSEPFDVVFFFPGKEFINLSSKFIFHRIEICCNISKFNLQIVFQKFV